MTLIVGSAVALAGWVCWAYGRDIVDTVRLLAEAPPERVVRHPHMRAMDRLRDDDPFPHGRCWCGAALDGRGICEDGASCARDGWDR